MKQKFSFHLIVLVCIFFIWVLYSCSKQYERDKSVQKIESILNNTDVAFKRLAFTELNVNEQVQILKAHLQDQLSSFRKERTKYNFIIKVMNSITPSSIEKNSDNQTKNALLEYEAHQIFSKDECYYLFYSLEKPDIKTLTAPEGSAVEVGAPAQNDCHCNSSSFWSCIFQKDCKKGAFDCNRKDSGCGWLLSDACDGKCVGDEEVDILE